jgi:protein arginine N-methyltransferase 1
VSSSLYYSLDAYGVMFADRVRTDGYTEALRRTVRPGSVVVDIGTGIGGHAFLACQLGARKVYAIEPSDGIEVAWEIATRNGFADRIEFIQNMSTKVDLPEKADVVVSDLRGATPVNNVHFASIIDARDRFLAPGGTLIPQRDTLFVAAAAADTLYADIVRPWDDNELGIDMSPARDRVLNTFHHGPVEPGGVLTVAGAWATIDYRTLTTEGARGQVSLPVERSGVAHGLPLWFQAELIDGVGYATGPDDPDSVYNRPFLPWPEPVALAVGDRVDVDLSAVRSGQDHIWSWRTRVVDEGGAVKASFAQSTFFVPAVARKKV